MPTVQLASTRVTWPTSHSAVANSLQHVSRCARVVGPEHSHDPTHVQSQSQYARWSASQRKQGVEYLRTLRLTNYCMKGNIKWQSPRSCDSRAPVKRVAGSHGKIKAAQCSLYQRSRMRHDPSFLLLASTKLLRTAVAARIGQKTRHSRPSFGAACSCCSDVIGARWLSLNACYPLVQRSSRPRAEQWKTEFLYNAAAMTAYSVVKPDDPRFTPRLQYGQALIIPIREVRFVDALWWEMSVISAKPE
ncbi:hypothetical protein MRB53_038265 [Persea americana]|nr:hypothetical protein MRB53_038265 [Persea americana]